MTSRRSGGGRPAPIMLIAPHTRRLTLTRPLDLRHTLGTLRNGKGDPTFLLRHDASMHACRTPDGPATVVVHVVGRRAEAESWGPGGAWALDHLPILLGEVDTADDFQPTHALVADLVARTPGLRIGASHRVFDAVLAAICGQDVSRFESRRTHRQIVQRYGEPAPGPGDLTLPPSPTALAGAEHRELHPLGLEERRADALRRAAARAQSLEHLVDLPPGEADARLRSLTGINLWSAAVIRHVALGDPDAVPVGDLHLKHVVAWAFHDERRGTDAQMLETLEPFRGHRARVLRLLGAARLAPPRARS